MKRITLWVCIALSVQVLLSQKLMVQAVQPNAFHLKSEDIFHLQITNPTVVSIPMHIKATWYYKGEKAIELISENFNLVSGLNTIQSNLIQVNTKTYYIKALDDIETATGMLPAGAYRACIQLECATPDCSGLGSAILDQEVIPCYDLQVEQPTPLLLSSPENGNVSNNHKPNFAWIPPMPMAGNINLTYVMTLVQKTGNKQSCTDAVLRNRPLYRQENIDLQTMNFPADIDALDTGDYAWQISAQYEGYTVATSDAWCFRVEEKRELRKLTVVDLYKPDDLKLKFYKIKLGDSISLKWQQPYAAMGNEKWKISMQGEVGGKVTDLSNFVVTPKYVGDGSIVIATSSLSHINKGTTYIFEAIGEKAEVFKTRIIFYE